MSVSVSGRAAAVSVARKQGKGRRALLATTALSAAVSLTLIADGAMAQDAVYNAGATTIDTDQTINGQLIISHTAPAEVILTDGAAVALAGVSSIGRESGSDGLLVVENGASLAPSSASLGTMFVGYSGSGTLQIANGGRVRNGYGLLGHFAGSTGSATVTGADSVWENSEELYVGRSGEGTLEIAGGGTVSVNSGLRVVWLASLAGSTGVLNIGAAAGEAAVAAGTLQAAEVRFGQGTSKTLNFNHTGTDYVFAPRITGTGVVNVYSGQTTLAANSIYGGQTNLHGGTLSLGHNNALGGSTLRALGGIVDYADGVTINNPVSLEFYMNEFQVLTGSATQSGAVTADGPDRVFVKVGEGTLVLTGANAWSGTSVAAGTLVMDGGVTVTDQGVVVGDTPGPDAALIIRNSANFSSANGFVGSPSGVRGAVTVTGSGSTWTNSGFLYVGYEGAGTLEIADGGTVSSGDNAIGYEAGST
ncbi:MAG: autotransporter-associated beta strand repeat-containing protein, partial [Brevundimonas sp.]